METPDIPELKPYVAGVVRGKKVSVCTRISSEVPNVSDVYVIVDTAAY